MNILQKYMKKFINWRRGYVSLKSSKWSSRKLKADSMRITSKGKHGEIPIYVGQECTRFTIKVKHLKLILSLFLKDEEAESDFEAHHTSSGGLWLPCDVEFFEELKEIIETESNPEQMEYHLHLLRSEDLPLCHSCRKTPI